VPKSPKFFRHYFRRKYFLEFFHFYFNNFNIDPTGDCRRDGGPWRVGDPQQPLPVRRPLQVGLPDGRRQPGEPGEERPLVPVLRILVSAEKFLEKYLF
jgi:hypothetical protein